MYVQQKSYRNRISDLYGSGGRQINSDPFTFAADSSPQQSGDVYLSLIMVQGELQPEIAELTLSSYRPRPASGRCPSLHPRRWPQPSLCCSAVGLIPGKGGESWCIPDKRLPGSLLSCSGDNLTHIYAGPSTRRAAHPHPRATSPEERALGTGCSACERKSSSSNLTGAALS